MSLLSVLVLSCRRIDLLQKTIFAARSHFATLEGDLEPAWICFDNGSSDSEQQELTGMEWDVLTLSNRNQGIGPAMNRMVAMVRTPYILNLQDDWLIENPMKICFARQCMDIMTNNPKIAQVKLDAHHFLDFHDRNSYDGPFHNSSQCTFYVQNPHMLWGGFTFPPAIARTEALWEIGPFREDQPSRRGWAESEYSSRFSQSFLCAKSPDMLLFKHIGVEASPGWANSRNDGMAR